MINNSKIHMKLEGQIACELIQNMFLESRISKSKVFESIFKKEQSLINIF